MLVSLPSRPTWLSAVFWGFLWVDGVLPQKGTWRTVWGMREVRGGTALGIGGFGGFGRNEMVWHVRVVLVQFAQDAGVAVFVAVVELSLVTCFCFYTVFSSLLLL